LGPAVLVERVFLSDLLHPMQGRNNRDLRQNIYNGFEIGIDNQYCVSLVGAE